MAAGDLITKNLEYEYRGWLFGADSGFIVEKMEGLLDYPTINTNDFDRTDEHGQSFGRDRLTGRTLRGKIMIPSYALDSSLVDVIPALKPVKNTSYEFVFQRNSAKRFALCRPRRFTLPSEWKVAQGLAELNVEWFAADPRIYSLTQSTESGTIIATQSSVQIDTTSAGDFSDEEAIVGSPPVITLTDQWTDPRISLSEAGNRQIKIDVTMAPADVLVIDVGAKTVTLNGSDAFDLVRTDNEWWEIQPGTNTIVANRTGTTGSADIDVAWYDAFLTGAVYA